MEGLKLLDEEIFVTNPVQRRKEMPNKKYSQYIKMMKALEDEFNLEEYRKRLKAAREYCGISVDDKEFTDFLLEYFSGSKDELVVNKDILKSKKPRVPYKMSGSVKKIQGHPISYYAKEVYDLMEFFKDKKFIIPNTLQEKSKEFNKLKQLNTKQISRIATKMGFKRIQIKNRLSEDYNKSAFVINSKDRDKVKEAWKLE